MTANTYYSRSIIPSHFNPITVPLRKKGNFVFFGRKLFLIFSSSKYIPLYEPVYGCDTIVSRLFILVRYIFRAYESKKKGKGGPHPPDPLSHAFLSLSLPFFLVRLSFSRIFEWTRRHVRGQPTAQFMKSNWNMAREMFMVSIPLWPWGKRSSWSRQVRTRLWKGRKRWWMQLLLAFPSCSRRSFKLLPQTPTTQSLVSACVCDIHFVWVIREV